VRLSKKDVIKIFKALSDEIRLSIFLYLLQDELCVCELIEILKIEQSRISHQLKTLKEASLVICERTGKWIVYKVNPEIKDSTLIKSLKTELKLSSEEQETLIEIKTKGIRENCKGN